MRLTAYAMEELLANGFPEYVISNSCKLMEDGSMSWSPPSARRVAVVLGLRKTAPGLSAVADRMLAQHATVCAVDRFWSDLGNMYDPKRTRLAVDKADKMMLVRNTYRLRHNITHDDREVESAFWIGQAVEAVEDEGEDSE